MSLSFEWMPLLPGLYYAVLASMVLLLLLVMVLKRLGDFWGRIVLCLFLVLLLVNPVFLNEVRTGLPDKLLVILDDSESQKTGARDLTAEAALKHIQAVAEKLPNLETVILRASSDPGFSSGGGTNIFSVLRNQMMAMPANQVAGTILITDGQVHDVPEDLGILARMRPYHVILTGKKSEFDRKVTVVSAPKYGVLGDEIEIRVRVDAFGARQGMPAAALSVLQDGALIEKRPADIGAVQNLSFKIQHPGQNVFEFSIPTENGELTESNNTVSVIVNAVRDRLRVLLISGAPHMGERAWRNLLKSDPAIDLVHFTILRSPRAIDPTPQHELSLIAFPVEELFQQRIKDFDLIIFDRYQQYTMLMPHYFKNIANFIESGGAFLMAMSTDAQTHGVMHPALANILPIAPNIGEYQITNQVYMPRLSKLGQQHPVTAALGPSHAQQSWGAWQTQVSAIAKPDSDVLMQGANDDPLLLLGKAGAGRIAVLTSDNIWLWSKGLKRAGPYTELLRNTAHWLMKEPELENDYIKAEVQGNDIRVAQRAISRQDRSVVMTDPAGKRHRLPLDAAAGGWAETEVTAQQQGIYSFDNGTRKAFAVVGSANNQEFLELHTTDKLLLPVVKQTKGSLIWFDETPDFELRQLAANAWSFGASDWIGLRRNASYAVQSVESKSLLPNEAGLLILLLLLLGAWRWESGKR